jgi:hypothetical protein
MFKSIFIGVLMGIIMSIIGSFLVSLIPFFPFYFIFKLSLLPSIIVFVIIALWTKPDETRSFKIWLKSFSALFLGSLLTFFNFNRMEGTFHFNRHSGSHLNWDAIITFNILYSLGIALAMSPLAYIVIKKIIHFKNASF